MFNSKEIYIDKFQYCYKIFKEKYFILLQKPQFPNQITHLDQQQDIFTYDQFLKFLDFLFSYHKLEQARKNPDYPQYTYDRQIAIFFFEKMHKFKINNQNFSSLPNFVKIYFLAEQKLIQKTQEATEIQQILRNERDQLEIKYQEALALEQKTQKSILNQQKNKKQNYLTVEIEEASVYEPSVLNQFLQNQNNNQNFQCREIDDHLNHEGYFLVINFEDNIEQTKISQIQQNHQLNQNNHQNLNQNQSQPIPNYKKINWNQVFTFNVDRLDSVINIYLMDSKKQSAYMFKIENSEGNLGIPLSSLNSQQKQVFNSFLFDTQGKQLNIQLKISIQFIFSKSQYFSEALNSWNQQINQEEQNLIQIQKDLKQIYSLISNLDLIISENQDIEKQQTIPIQINPSQPNSNKKQQNTYNSQFNLENQQEIFQNQNLNVSNFDINNNYQQISQRNTINKLPENEKENQNE